jgi:hypothetical protein
MAKERKVPKHLHELTGDPDVAYDEATDGRDPRAIAAWEKQVFEQIEAQDDLAKQEGISIPEWNMPSEEHLGRNEGLTESIKHQERERILRPIRNATREDWDRVDLNQQFIDDLWSDWRDQYGADYTEQEVAQAATRVKQRYETEGSLNALRKIDRNRDQFMDDLYTELVVGGGARPSQGEAQRTQGTGSLGGGRGRGPMRDSDEGEPMSSPIQRWQKDKGYY